MTQPSLKIHEIRETTDGSGDIILSVDMDMDTLRYFASEGLRRILIEKAQIAIAGKENVKDSTDTSSQ